MKKIEKTLINEAKRFYEEAKIASIGGNKNSTTEELAEMLGMTLERYCREQCIQSFNKCNVICDLAFMDDSGLSDETKATLNEISNNAIKLIR